MIDAPAIACSGEDTILLERNSIDIKFQDVSYRIPQGRNAPKIILKNVSGIFKSGQLTAILGPSGAGKSTLLNVLAGYKCHGISGTIYINGKIRNMKEFRRISRYIMQEDLLQKWLTAEELMMLAADLKLSNKISQQKKKETVLEILDLLRLTKAKDTMTDKLSGGERKRLSIAIELVNNPPIIFLDEPTTGLDDLASAQCITLLKSLATGGRTIICSIHTPSARLFAQFDQSYVLADGMCVYQGYGPNVVDYLSNIGLICPTHYNPADFMIEVCCSEYGNFTDKLAAMANNQFVTTCESLQERSAKYDLSEFSCNTSHEVSIPFQFKTIIFRMWKQMLRDKNHILLKLFLHILLGVFVGYIFYDIANDGSQTIYNFGFFYCCLVFFLYIPLMPILLYSAMANNQFVTTCESLQERSAKYDLSEFSCNTSHEVSIPFQFKTIIFRMWKQMLRDKNHILLKLFLHILLGVFVGYIFYDIANDGSQTIYNFGFFYCCLVFFLYIPLMPILLYFPTEVQLIKREYFNRWYSLRAYFAAMTVSTIPVTIIMSVLFLTPTYVISGQPLEAHRFLYFCMIFILTAFVSESFGLIVSSFLNVVNSMFLAPSCSVPFMLLAVYGMGFGHVGIPITMKIMMHLSYLRYSLEAVVNAVMRDRGILPCAQDEKLCFAFADPNVFLEIMGFEERNIWVDFGALLFIYVLFRVVCYNLLRQRLSPNKTFRALQLIVRLVKSHISVSR
ncbi:ABC-2 type transporter [Popillia japonica]|uniref:ABC-2 type transporter n=1 Tax=Popillia japonica TaxID=7064 RepID=A0AAW1JXK3_POPJA